MLDVVSGIRLQRCETGFQWTSTSCQQQPSFLISRIIIHYGTNQRWSSCLTNKCRDQQYWVLLPYKVTHPNRYLCHGHHFTFSIRNKWGNQYFGMTCNVSYLCLMLYWIYRCCYFTIYSWELHYTIQFPRNLPSIEYILRNLNSITLLPEVYGWFKWPGGNLY